MEVNSKIFVAGHKGLVGSAIVRKLKDGGYKNIITRTRSELDLLNLQDVDAFFKKEKPQYVFLCAAKVGGIKANEDYVADFTYENLQIQNNVISRCAKHEVVKLLFLGSSCIYPKLSKQPIKEEYLLTGALEETNYGYAIAKIVGIKMCEAYNQQYGCNFISLMPTNIYGINDNFDLNTSHVLPALIRKFHEAKESNKKTVTIWGTGNPKREFLHSDDLADACVFVMNNNDASGLINAGVGRDIEIKELANLISEVVGFKGELAFDSSKPDGTPQKLLDVSKINSLGWKAKIELKDGISKVYDWYRSNNN